MTYTPNLEFETDIENLSPAEAHDRWEEVTNLQENDLRALKASERNDVYLDRAEGNQGADNPPIPGGPLDATAPRMPKTSLHRVATFSTSRLTPAHRTLPKRHKTSLPVAVAVAVAVALTMTTTTIPCASRQTRPRMRRIRSQAVPVAVDPTTD